MGTAQIAKSGSVYDYFQPNHDPDHIRSLDGLPVGTRFYQMHTFQPREDPTEYVLAGAAFLHQGGFYVIPAIYLHDHSPSRAILTTVGLESYGLVPLEANMLKYHQQNWLRRVDAPPMPAAEIRQHLTQMLTWVKNPESIVEVERCLAAL